MTTPDEFQRSQARVAQATLLLVRREWDKLESLDDWDTIANRVTVMAAAGQQASAQRAVTYTADVLGVDPVVRIAAFAGIAADRRPLKSLLYSAVVAARTTYDIVDDQLDYGRKHLTMIAHTAVADAGRGAAGVQIAATPGAGYVRVVSPPCCQRCAVLAGKLFRWSDGFERHPQCDCVHAPARDDRMPDGYTFSIDSEDIRDLTAAQRLALEDGADLSQVINSHRNRTRGGMTTSEGMTKRGIAFHRGARGARLTPEAIYKTAATRDEAIALLKRHGYVRP